MPLSKRARVEVYLPNKKTAASRRLRAAVENELLHTFGGCTLIRDIKGFYLCSDGHAATDRIDLLYADAPFDLSRHVKQLARYTDELRQALSEASNEESILIVAHELYHSV